MSKPHGEKCDQCAVKNNKLRCGMCKHAPNDWIFGDDGPCIVGDFDGFVQKENDQAARVPGPDQRFNCPNCCAAITGPYCEYCGTVFDQQYQKQDQQDDDVVIPIYIGQHHVDDVIQAFNHFHDVAHRIGGS